MGIQGGRGDSGRTKGDGRWEMGIQGCRGDDGRGGEQKVNTWLQGRGGAENLGGEREG